MGGRFLLSSSISPVCSISPTFSTHVFYACQARSSESTHPALLTCIHPVGKVSERISELRAEIMKRLNAHMGATAPATDEGERPPALCSMQSCGRSVGHCCKCTASAFSGRLSKGRGWAHPMSHSTCMGLTTCLARMGTFHLAHAGDTPLTTIEGCAAIAVDSVHGRALQQMARNSTCALTQLFSCALQWTCWRSRCPRMKRLMQPPRPGSVRRRGGAASDIAAAGWLSPISWWDDTNKHLHPTKYGL